VFHSSELILRATPVAWQGLWLLRPLAGRFAHNPSRNRLFMHDMNKSPRPRRRPLANASLTPKCSLPTHPRHAGSPPNARHRRALRPPPYLRFEARIRTELMTTGSIGASVAGSVGSAAMRRTIFLPPTTLPSSA